MKNLDDILLAATVGSRITLDSDGVYYTRGRPQSGAPNLPALKQGCYLQGQGSIVRVIPNQSLYSIDSLYCEGDNVINDLTVDIAAETATTLATKKANGIWVESGSSNLLTRCHVIGQWGTIANNKESFGIRVKGAYSQIRGCTVTNPSGNYCSAILNQAGQIDSCKVHWPATLPAGYFWVSYNLEQSTNLDIVDSESIGGRSAIYVEAVADGVQNVSIHGCNLYRTLFGLHMNAQETVGQVDAGFLKNFLFHGNKVSLAFSSATELAGVLLDHTWTVYSESANNLNSISGVQIDSNEFTYDDPTGGVRSDCYVANIATNCLSSDATHGIFDVKFLNNTYDSRMLWRNKGSKAVRVQSDKAVTWQTT